MQERSHEIAEQTSFVSQVLSTLGQASRWRLLRLLAPTASTEPLGLIERQPQELAVSLGLAPSTVSEHLRKLTEMQFVVARRQGNTRWYRLKASPYLSSFLMFLRTLEDKSSGTHEIFGEERRSQHDRPPTTLNNRAGSSSESHSGGRG